MEETAEKETSDEEFNPTGTAFLLAVYMFILIAMWCFMYFVEFLGGGPTIIAH